MESENWWYYDIDFVDGWSDVLDLEFFESFRGKLLLFLCDMVYF